MQQIIDFIFLTITYSAGYLVVAVVTILSVFSFLLHKHKRRVWPLLISVLGTGGSVLILKYLFNASRPAGALYLESTPSFPSGHAALAMALYGFLFIAIWKYEKHPLKSKGLLLLALLIFFIGVSRLYLGVHYMEDVLVGYLVGLIWVWIGFRFGLAASKSKI